MSKSTLQVEGIDSFFTQVKELAEKHERLQEMIKSVKEREVAVQKREDEVEQEIQKRMAEERDTLTTQITNLKREKEEQLEEKLAEVKRIKTETDKELEEGQELLNGLMKQYEDMVTKVDDKDDPIVTLNVGGTVFKTHLSTLTKYSESYFGIMFTKFRERYELDKTHFIDRDPNVFRVVLQYLRTGKLFPSMFFSILEIKAELEWFNIPLEKKSGGSEPSIINNVKEGDFKELSRYSVKIVNTLGDNTGVFVKLPSRMGRSPFYYVHDIQYADGFLQTYVELLYNDKKINRPSYHAPLPPEIIPMKDFIDKGLLYDCRVRSHMLELRISLNSELFLISLELIKTLFVGKRVRRTVNREVDIDPDMAKRYVMYPRNEVLVKNILNSKLNPNDPTALSYYNTLNSAQQAAIMQNVTTASSTTTNTGLVSDSDDDDDDDM